MRARAEALASQDDAVASHDGAVARHRGALASQDGAGAPRNGAHASDTALDGVPFDEPEPGPEPGWLDEVLSGFDTRFDAMRDSASSAVTGQEDPEEGKDAAASEADVAVVQALFYDIASNYLKPVHFFIAELRRGPSRADWIQIARPALENIQRAALDVGVESLDGPIGRVVAELSGTEGRGETVIRGAARDAILADYEILIDAAPGAFAIDEALDSSRSLVVHSLLSSIPGVGRVTIDRLYRVGLVAVELIVMASPEDLTLTAGVRRDLAELIVQNFQRYHKEVSSQRPEVMRKSSLERLSDILRTLAVVNGEYEASLASHATANRIRARQARQALLTKAHLVLGQMGEVALAEELEKLPVERRIEELQRFLANA
ncbi:MAG: hypothetical protein IPK13_16880 [Deltaproteobacteria bacterium]|nr:hypothetical protein [Deltaproteobacteria bacterium]